MVAIVEQTGLRAVDIPKGLLRLPFEIDQDDAPADLELLEDDLDGRLVVGQIVFSRQSTNSCNIDGLTIETIIMGRRKLTICVVLPQFCVDDQTPIAEFAIVIPARMGKSYRLESEPGDPVSVTITITHVPSDQNLKGLNFTITLTRRYGN